MQIRSPKTILAKIIFFYPFKFEKIDKSFL